MLVSELRDRAQKCAELSQKLREEGANHPEAGDWIFEISKLALSRREERHVAIVSTIKRIEKRIVAIQSKVDKKNDLSDHIVRLKERLAEMSPSDPGFKRFGKKLATMTEALNQDVPEVAKLPALHAKLESLKNSEELLSREEID